MTAHTSNRKRTLPGRSAVLAACVLLSGSLGIANAAVPGEEVPTVVVAYGDIDLGTDEGVRALYSRITFAASHVCPFQEAMDAEHVALFKSCRDAAITRAVSAIKSPQLAALRAEHAKRG
jgi:UrcA family protein